MKLGHWDEARLDAAILAFYVAELTIPSTTEKFRRPSVQIKPVSTSVLDQRNRSLLFVLPMRPNEVLHHDPTDHASRLAFGAHSWLEVIQFGIATRDWIQVLQR